MGYVASVKDPDNGVHGYTYNQLGRLTEGSHPESLETTFSYDDSNRRTSRTQPNGVVTNWIRSGGALTGIEAKYGSTVYASWDYAYDDKGCRSRCLTRRA